MGLEFTEMILIVEESFGIEIKDQETYNISTPKELNDLVVGKLKLTDQTTCSSLQSFNLLRKTLVNNFGVQRSEIKLDTSIRDIVMIKNEKIFWLELQKAISAQVWPQLTFSYPVSLLKRIFEIIIPIWFVLHTNSFLSFITLSIGSLVSIVFIEIIYLKLGKRFGSKIHHRYDSIQSILGLMKNSDKFKWAMEEISNEIRFIITEKCGIDPKDYREDLHFFRDLDFG